MRRTYLQANQDIVEIFRSLDATRLDRMRFFGTENAITDVRFYYPKHFSEVDQALNELLLEKEDIQILKKRLIAWFHGYSDSKCIQRSRKGRRYNLSYQVEDSSGRYKRTYYRSNIRISFKRTPGKHTFGIGTTDL